MKVRFNHPLSDTRQWEGELEVTATVDGRDAEIDQVILVDRNGRRADVTALIDNWCGSLYDSLCEAAVNNSINDEDFSECRNRQYA